MLQDKNFQQTETLNHNTIILLVWEQVPGKHFALQILQFYARWVASLADFFPSLLGACLKAIILQIKFTISICTKIPKVEFNSRIIINYDEIFATGRVCISKDTVRRRENQQHFEQRDYQPR